MCWSSFCEKYQPQDCELPAPTIPHENKDLYIDEHRARLNALIRSGDQVWTATDEEILDYIVCRRHLQIETVSAAAGEESYRLQMQDLPAPVASRQVTVDIKVPLRADPEEQLDAFAVRISDCTRLLAVSHVTTETGFRLPVEQLCGLASERSVLTFVDAAHSAGLFPIDLAAMGCDFAGILSYKWMYAPYAAGALYVHPDRLEALQVTYAGGRAEAWLRYDTDDYALKEGAERFEYGPWSWPLVHTWAFAAGYLTDIGLGSIWARTAQLTDRLKQALGAIPGVTLYTPLEAECSAALAAFSVANWDGEELTRALRERGPKPVIVRPLTIAHNGVRASVSFFLLEEEIDLLADAVESLAASRR